MLGCLENAIECGKALEAGTHGHFSDGDVRLDQQRFRMGDSFLHQIFIAGYAGELLEQPGKMKFRKTGQAGQIININVLGTVVGNIFADFHKLFDIFMLLVGSDSREFLTGIKIGTPDGHEEPNHQRIDQCLGEWHFIVILAADFIQIGA